MACAASISAGMRLTSGSAASAASRSSERRTASSSARLFHLRQPLELCRLHARVDRQRGRRHPVLLDVGIDAHLPPLTAGDLGLEGVGGVRDLRDEPPVINARDDSVEHRSRTGLEQMGEDGLSLSLHDVGELLDEPRAAERVGDVDHAGLLGDDLLGPQREPGGVLGGERQRLVERIGMQALCAPEYAGERLKCDADEVDLGLLGGERDARRLRVEAQQGGAAVGRAIAIVHPAGPDAAGGAVLGDLLEEVDVRVEEEAEPRREAPPPYPPQVPLRRTRTRSPG